MPNPINVNSASAALSTRLTETFDVKLYEGKNEVQKVLLKVFGNVARWFGYEGAKLPLKLEPVRNETTAILKDVFSQLRRVDPEMTADFFMKEVGKQFSLANCTFEKAHEPAEQSNFFIGLQREIYSAERAIIHEERIKASKGEGVREDGDGVIISEKGGQSFQERNIKFSDNVSVDLQNDTRPVISSETDPLEVTPLRVTKEEEPLLHKRDIHIGALNAIRTDFQEHFLNQSDPKEFTREINSLVRRLDNIGKRIDELVSQNWSKIASAQNAKLESGGKDVNDSMKLYLSLNDLAKVHHRMLDEFSNIASEQVHRDVLAGRETAGVDFSQVDEQFTETETSRDVSEDVPDFPFETRQDTVRTDRDDDGLFRLEDVGTEENTGQLEDTGDTTKEIRNLFSGNIPLEPVEVRPTGDGVVLSDEPEIVSTDTEEPEQPQVDLDRLLDEELFGDRS